MTIKEIEELKAEMRANAEKQQNEFANKILADIQWWCEKANRKDYVPTDEEKECLREVITIVNDMNNWF